jgi:hypothetical protein
MKLPIQAQPVTRKVSTAEISSSVSAQQKLSVLPSSATICDLCCAGVPLEVCSRIRCACSPYQSPPIIPLPVVP